eukprot:Em0021g701a
MSLSTTDFGLPVEMVSLEAIEEMMAEAKLHPYDSATMGTHTQLSSEHLGSLARCFLASVTCMNSSLSQHSRFQKGFHQKVPNPVVAGDHISTILAGDCMMTEVIK